MGMQEKRIRIAADRLPVTRDELDKLEILAMFERMAPHERAHVLGVSGCITNWHRCPAHASGSSQKNQVPR